MSTQIKLKTLETEFKDYRTKFATLSKITNTAMQRVGETKKGLHNLTKVVTKLENKN